MNFSIKKTPFLLILPFAVFFAEPVAAQATAADSGKIVIVQDQKIAQLVAKHVEINSRADIRGFRVKIHFGADKNKAKEIKAKFISRFPDIPAYEKYDQPNFNIRVGDFRTRLEAYRALKEIQVEFPAAFIVQDNIEFPSLEPVSKP